MVKTDTKTYWSIPGIVLEYEGQNKDMDIITDRWSILVDLNNIKTQMSAPNICSMIKYLDPVLQHAFLFIIQQSIEEKDIEANQDSTYNLAYNAIWAFRRTLHKTHPFFTLNREEKINYARYSEYFYENYDRSDLRVKIGAHTLRSYRYLREVYD